MKLLRIIATVDPRSGGPISGIRKIDRHLRALGVEAEVLSLDPPESEAIAGFPIPVHPLGKPRTSRFARWASYTPAAIDWLRNHVSAYDAVAVHGLWNYATHVARRALVGGDTPYVVYPHGMLDPWFAHKYPAKTAVKRVLWRVNEGPLLNGANAVLFTSEEERLQARIGYRPWSVTERVVRYGTEPVGKGDADDLAAFRSRVPHLQDRPFLLFLGRLHEKKGCELLVRAYAAHRETLDADLVMAGPDDTGIGTGLRALAQQLGVGLRIHWPGMVTGAVKRGALHLAQAFVLPSHQENFGIAVAEAMSCSVPVLVSDKVNIWREIEQAGAGLVEPDTQQGTSALLERWSNTTPHERADMKRAATSLYEDRFTAAAAAEDLADVLHEITQ